MGLLLGAATMELIPWPWLAEQTADAIRSATVRQVGLGLQRSDLGPAGPAFSHLLQFRDSTGGIPPGELLFLREQRRDVAWSWRKSLLPNLLAPSGVSCRLPRRRTTGAVAPVYNLPQGSAALSQNWVITYLAHKASVHSFFVRFENRS